MFLLSYPDDWELQNETVIVMSEPKRFTEKTDKEM